MQWAHLALIVDSASITDLSRSLTSAASMDFAPILRFSNDQSARYFDQLARMNVSVPLADFEKMLRKARYVLKDAVDEEWELVVDELALLPEGELAVVLRRGWENAWDSIERIVRLRSLDAPDMLLSYQRSMLCDSLRELSGDLTSLNEERNDYLVADPDEYEFDPFFPVQMASVIADCLHFCAGPYAANVGLGLAYQELAHVDAYRSASGREWSPADVHPMQGGDARPETATDVYDEIGVWLPEHLLPHRPVLDYSGAREDFQEMYRVTTLGVGNCGGPPAFAVGEQLVKFANNLRSQTFELRDGAEPDKIHAHISQFADGCCQAANDDQGIVCWIELIYD